jgi:hypothetical protein
MTPLRVVETYVALGVIVMLLGFALAAQDASKPPALPTAKPLTVSAEVENRILRAERDFSDLTAVQLRAENQFRQAQADYNAAEAKKPAATKAVSDAIEAAWQESHLPKDSYTFDPASFTFTPKEKPAAKNDLGAKPK